MDDTEPHPPDEVYELFDQIRDAIEEIVEEPVDDDVLALSEEE